MEEPLVGDVVIFSFPFSDLTSTKRRPALVIATPSGSDIIVCQITSKIHHDSYSIGLDDNDFINGKLNVNSYIRPNKLITIDKKIIIYKAGSIQTSKLKSVIGAIFNILNLEGVR